MSRRVWRSVATLSGHRRTAAAVTATALQLPRRECCGHRELKHAETTPAEYMERRQRFFQYLPPHSITLLPAADEFTYSRDILSPHRQDSLWYHLFGLSTALRRQLEPPSLITSEDVRATMAVLARGADNSTHTILCVPPVTVDLATLVWASETTPLAYYEERLRAPAQTKELGNSETTSAVITNDVGTICEVLRCLISQMAAQQITKWAEDDGVLSESTSARPAVAERVARDRRNLLRVMPRVFAAYPQQLRWDGRHYRLPRSPQQHPHEEEEVSQEQSAKSAQTFHHPLEALFNALDSTAFTVLLPRLIFEDTSQPPWDSVTFNYKTATAYTPGLVSPRQAPSTASAEKQVSISASAPAKHAVNSPTPAARGKVCLSIRRVDSCAWAYRLLKCPSQVRQHLRSARATEHAFVDLMHRSATAASEHDLQCTFQRSVCDCSAHFGAASRVRSAYIPVIASGVRSTDIHYTDNFAELTSLDVGVVRVDAGVEVENVPTDCTRTFPIGFVTFQCPQLAQLYDGLVQIQRALLRRIAPGVAMRDIAKLHLDETRALLCSLGVDVRREKSACSLEEACRLEDVAERERQLPMSTVRSCFCAHSYGHLFGLDIHEEWGAAVPVGSSTDGALEGLTTATSPHVFKGGMMHTVEPGIYMPSLHRASLFGLTAAHLPDAFHKGVGMQVEDDVLVLPYASNEGDAATHGHTTSPACPWSRGVYLQHALAAFARYYGNALACDSKSPRSSLASPSAAVLLCQKHIEALLKTGAITSAPSTHVRNVVYLLFSQRLAVDGYAPAVAAISSDISTAQKLTFVASPAYASAPPLVPCASHTEWYPYSVLVLTATVPKDRNWIESLMLQSV
ncbi:aminopeptidase P1 putative metallo-peptidase Clan MG Family M24 [Leptomonas seymouri]|uniref:Aminopeptidase P1 putative metallo-peptidase Clan MG Family M24 n=1 Tax=Leptomonas seymouri TaxID=5684 RepID=A0A0N0P918_LEPSE|nr:aminopeptidase P1 putative metallo-peptidase Clan MG Family M24 [Leptomonas seymouri]|eukprot:KPI90589.1 aminopeptidase P1 putative metallo-peptidase Clan MG Family M24 [Leptomonas seymouri]